MFDTAAAKNQIASITSYAGQPLSLVGTAAVLHAMFEPVDPVKDSQTDYTPSDDEECFVHIAKTEEDKMNVAPTRGQSFYCATSGLYYDITEAHRKGSALTSRYRCRIVQEVTE